MRWCPTAPQIHRSMAAGKRTSHTAGCSCHPRSGGRTPATHRGHHPSLALHSPPRSIEKPPVLNPSRARSIVFSHLMHRSSLFAEISSPTRPGCRPHRRCQPTTDMHRRCQRKIGAIGACTDSARAPCGGGAAGFAGALFIGAQTYLMFDVSAIHCFGGMHICPRSQKPSG